MLKSGKKKHFGHFPAIWHHCAKIKLATFFPFGTTVQKNIYFPHKMVIWRWASTDLCCWAYKINNSISAWIKLPFLISEPNIMTLIYTLYITSNHPPIYYFFIILNLINNNLLTIYFYLVIILDEADICRYNKFSHTRGWNSHIDFGWSPRQTNYLHSFK